MIDKKLLDELSDAKAASNTANARARAAAQASKEANAEELKSWERYQRARQAVEDAA